MKNEEKNNCSHNFEYSHKETVPIDAGALNYKEVDVVVCKKCGDVRRN